MRQPRKPASAKVSGTGLTKAPGTSHPTHGGPAKPDGTGVQTARGVRAVMESDAAAALEREARLQFERHHRHNRPAKAVSPCRSPNFPAKWAKC
jgi:hypothetical protein